MELKTEGLVFLIFAWSFIFCLLGFCYYKVLTIDQGNNNKEKN